MTYGDFLKWLVYYGKSIYKGMMTGGTPISGNLHLPSSKPRIGPCRSGFQFGRSLDPSSTGHQVQFDTTHPDGLSPRGQLLRKDLENPWFYGESGLEMVDIPTSVLVYWFIPVTLDQKKLESRLLGGFIPL